MPILELPPNSSRTSDPAEGSGGEGSGQRMKLRGRFGDLEEHEIVRLLDSIDDELSKARFRESIYISTILCLALAWFLFYGPRILFHQPQYKDLISAMKEHDKQMTTLEMPRTIPRAPVTHSVPDHKTLQQLQKQSRATPAAPSPAQPKPQEQTPQEQARATAPPVVQPPLPQLSAPKPAAATPLVDAPMPQPSVAQNTPSAHDGTQGLSRPHPGVGGGASYGPAPGSSGPLQAGATILSDTMGVDFTEYMKRLHHDIQRNWDPLIPIEAQAPLMKKGIVGIRFTILPNGKVGGMTLEFKSGAVALDKAAWFAITSEGDFPPLPKEFHGPLLELRVGFYYNTPIQQ